MRPTAAFTLIELLVVVAIIAVLLALLTPALDKAVYQAELVRCGANLKGIAGGVQIYATDFRRQYPHRPVVRANAEPKLISQGNSDSDSRPLLRSYMNINGHLLCPFVPEKVDLDGSKSTTLIESPYNLFFGVQYAKPEGGVNRGMLKLGDRLEFEGETYNILANDLDTISKTYGIALSSHADFEGVGRPEVAQDNTNYVVLWIVTLSRWTYVSYERPPLDGQHVSDDGAVGRHERVTWDEAEPTGTGRMAKLPAYTSLQDWTGGQGSWIHIPKK